MLLVRTLCPAPFTDLPDCFCRISQDLDGQEADYISFGLNPPELRWSDHNLVPTTALLSFKAAVQAGLERRRLLVLAVLSVQPGTPLPANTLQHICKLAELVLWLLVVLQQRSEVFAAKTWALLQSQQRKVAQSFLAHDHIEYGS